MKLLLHTCCGPCSLYVIDALKNRYPDAEITGYFYNPNIHPYDELMRRSHSTAQACEYKNIQLITDLTYNIACWKCFDSIGADRCKMCYETRFNKACTYASENGFTHFTSTLFVSPYQNHETMNIVAKAAADKNNIIFLENSDFRDGFRDGQNQAKNMGLYRQKYCGCIRSLSGE